MLIGFLFGLVAGGVVVALPAFHALNKLRDENTKLKGELVLQLQRGARR